MREARGWERGAGEEGREKRGACEMMRGDIPSDVRSLMNSSEHRSQRITKEGQDIRCTCIAIYVLVASPFISEKDR